MTDKKDEALKLALEAICGSGDFLFNWHDCEPNNEREMQRYQATLADNEKAFKAIKEALAEQPAQELLAWKNAAIRVGEELSSVGPNGYYNMTADQWLAWAMDQQPRGKNSLAEQPAQQQEPVATVADLTPQKRHDFINAGWDSTDPLYTSPPASKPWTRLTDEQKVALCKLFPDHLTLNAIDVIEAKLKEKNK